jgi:uncharacterized protein
VTDADVIVVGAGLAGLAATAELTEAGRRVLLLEQEPESSLGGQAAFSMGGLFLANTPEQRRIGVRDSADLAWQDWLGSAGFDRGVDDPSGEDFWGYQWARAYVDFAAGEARSWLHGMGVRWLPVVGWAERGGGLADGPGNSVPRLHLTWGTGPALVEPFERRVRAAAAAGRVEFRFRHRVDELIVTGGAIDGVRGAVLEPSTTARGIPSSRVETGDFEVHAPAVLVTSGGIGGNHDLIRQNWPERLGPPPEQMLSGVPEHVDGRMLAITEKAGGRLVNRDRMWHYPDGVEGWDPLWPGYGVHILAGPSPLWLDARGRRLPPPNFPGFDTLATLEAILGTGYTHSWFLLNKKIAAKEILLAGSIHNPAMAAKSVRGLLLRKGPSSTESIRRHGADLVFAPTVPELAASMNALTGEELVDPAVLGQQIIARDREMDNHHTKDQQVIALHQSRGSRVERMTRTAAPHKILAAEAGPLVAIRLRVLTRKTMGGLQTDLASRVVSATSGPVPGLYAAGEAAGFGGGGVHGYRSLEGTFLGGSMFTGRQAGRAIAAETS